MSDFKEMIRKDVKSIFLNIDEFAEKRTIVYDGDTYTDVPIVLRGIKEEDRARKESDHAQGIYLVTSVMHCDFFDLGGKQPEKGTRIKINNKEGSGGFFREFYVASSVCEAGMLRVELEAIDE